MFITFNNKYKNDKIMSIPIAVAHGDGIGPEIMKAVLRILEASSVDLDIHTVEIGEKIYLKGEKSGISKETWDTIKNCRAFLKAPITTPQGGGFKSLNVTVRTTLGLFANVRPCRSYYPFVKTDHKDMDVVVIRENEEDLYCGIEYRPTPECFEALKIITRPGSERICRFAFEYAKANDRKKVTCFTKDNILKLSDGLFHQVFMEIANEYPEIENEHWIIDIGTAKLANAPELFDVLVLPNLYGDILSDVGAEISGSVGMVGSANIGEMGAMFEAIHGSAPKHAGENSANPSALLLGAVQMLNYLGETKAATSIHNAWLKTLEDGIHTFDIHSEASFKKVGTQEFADAVIERFGKSPTKLEKVQGGKTQELNLSITAPKVSKKELVGVDIFVYHNDSLETLVSQLEKIKDTPLTLKMISNRGVTVWPGGHSETLTVDNWRIRFTSKNGAVTQEMISNLLSELVSIKIEFTELHTLLQFDDKPGYTVSPLDQ